MFTGNVILTSDDFSCFALPCSPYGLFSFSDLSFFTCSQVLTFCYVLVFLFQSLITLFLLLFFFFCCICSTFNFSPTCYVFRITCCFPLYIIIKLLHFPESQYISVLKDKQVKWERQLSVKYLCCIMGCFCVTHLQVILAQTSRDDKMKDERNKTRSVDSQDHHEGKV